MLVDLAPVLTWDPQEPAKMLPSDLRYAASWPLAFSLSCLAERMRDDSWALGAEMAARLDQ